LKASDFLAAYGSRGPAVWEAAALELAKKNEVPTWPLANVTSSDGARTLVFKVATDYFSVGEPGDLLRLPLTPTKAQEVADVWGMLLPTPKMVKLIADASVVRLNPHPLAPNLGASLTQYLAHSQEIDKELAGASGLASGLKKDVVLGNLWKPGKVLIYGWIKPNAPAGDANEKQASMMSAPAGPSWRVQPYSNVHGDFYVDYSHGARLVHPVAVLDGAEVKLADVMRDPALASLVSWEGPLKTTRYPTPTAPVAAPKDYVPTTPDLAELGRQTVARSYLEAEHLEKL